MKKEMKFNLWIWFTPIVGFFYLLIFGFLTTFRAKIYDVFDGDNKPIWFVIVAQLYIVVHVYGGALFTAWMLSLFNVI